MTMSGKILDKTVDSSIVNFFKYQLEHHFARLIISVIIVCCLLFSIFPLMNTVECSEEICQKAKYDGQNYPSMDGLNCSCPNNF